MFGSVTLLSPCSLAPIEHFNNLLLTLPTSGTGVRVGGVTGTIPLAAARHRPPA